MGLFRRKKGRRYGKPHRQIEKTRRINTLEMIWHKEPREDLKEAAIIRAGDWIQSREPKGKERMTVHTHPKKSQREFLALPSAMDMGIMFRRSRKGTTTHVISCINESGKETGRTFIKMGRKFFEKGLTEKRNDWLKRYTNTRKEERVELLKELKSLGVSIRFVPMPGYRFDRRICEFVRVQGHRAKK